MQQHEAHEEAAALQQQKTKRVLPPLMIKGAAAMAEDHACISNALFPREEDILEKPSKRTRRLTYAEEETLNRIIDLAARAEILGLVGNTFSRRSRLVHGASMICLVECNV